MRVNHIVLHDTITYNSFNLQLIRMTDSNKYMSFVSRNPIFGVSDQVRHKPGCTATDNGQRLEISDLGSRVTESTIYIAKTKVLISCAVTVQLICTFVLAKKQVFS